MVTQQRLKPKNSKTSPLKQATVPIKETQVNNTGLTLAKSPKKNKPKPKVTLSETQKALRVAQSKVKQERQARIKAEKALAEAQRALVIEPLDDDEERRIKLRRVSFIVRLILDRRDQYVRMEIEQVSSNRKQNFPSLDGEGLVKFMNACVRPTINLEESLSTAPPAKKMTAITEGHHTIKSSIVISNVQIFHPEHADFVALTLPPEKPFLIQIHFRFQGTDSIYITTQKSTFEIKFYANEVTNGKFMLLTNYKSKVIPSVLEYTASAQMPGLPFGMYRLFMVIILRAPIKMAGFYGKMIINVT